MSALSTHDTKRSEDVRARLAAVSEVPAEWVVAVAGLAVTGGRAGDGPLEWLLWQTLVGAWPLDAQRLTRYLVKAAREAKLRTSWTLPDADVRGGAGRLRPARARRRRRTRPGSPRRSTGCTPGSSPTASGSACCSWSLPGVPDLYQGCESVSLRLVDPDNRVPPDPVELAAVLDRALAAVPDPIDDLGAAKAPADRAGPAHPSRPSGVVRRRGVVRPRSTRTGRPTSTWSRAPAPAEVVAVATRLALRLAAGGGWRATPSTFPAGSWTDVLTGRAHHSVGLGVPAADLLGAWPVALLVRDGG